jgi:DNA-binding beta-propeller fold protein YncE
LTILDGGGSALRLGPTGLAFDPVTGILYVASTLDNAIFAIANAAFASQPQGTGKIVYKDSAHLRGPLALAFTPNGHLITTNGDAVNPSSTPSQRNSRKTAISSPSFQSIPRSAQRLESPSPHSS